MKKLLYKKTKVDSKSYEKRRVLYTLNKVRENTEILLNHFLTKELEIRVHVTEQKKKQNHSFLLTYLFHSFLGLRVVIVNSFYITVHPLFDIFRL